MGKDLTGTLFNLDWPVEARVRGFNDAQTIYTLGLRLSHQTALHTLMTEQLQQKCAECEELARHYGNLVHQLQKERAMLLTELSRALGLLEEKGLSKDLQSVRASASLCDEDGIPF
jgi:hypothetical protein